MIRVKVELAEASGEQFLAGNAPAFEQQERIGILLSNDHRPMAKELALPKTLGHKRRSRRTRPAVGHRFLASLAATGTVGKYCRSLARAAFGSLQSTSRSAIGFPAIPETAPRKAYR